MTNDNDTVINTIYNNIQHMFSSMRCNTEDFLALVPVPPTCRCAYELCTAVSINLLSGNATEASERAFDEGDHSALQPNTSCDTVSSPKHDAKA